MRILVATDAWHPQVNGVVRTLTSLARYVPSCGATVDFLSPEGFATVPMPTYPSLRLALPRASEIARRVERSAPDAIHVATEGPIGLAVRRYCMRRSLPFTTSYTTRYPEYIAARFAIPERWSYAALRRFHAPAAVTMVSTPTLMQELAGHGFSHLALWTRGVDTTHFRPEPRADLGLPRPIFAYAGRVAIEKNIEAFLALDLPGSKLVIGDGPQEAELRRRFPTAHFAGVQHGATLTAMLAAADVFVFPSRTDTFGVVLLEALACGVPVAAFPVAGPKDVIRDPSVGVLSEDLRAACLAALPLSRDRCRTVALGYSWSESARQFVEHLRGIAAPKPQPQPSPSAVMAATRRG